MQSNKITFSSAFMSGWTCLSSSDCPAVMWHTHGQTTVYFCTLTADTVGQFQCVLKIIHFFIPILCLFSVTFHQQFGLKTQVQTCVNLSSTNCQITLKRYFITLSSSVSVALCFISIFCFLKGKKHVFPPDSFKPLTVHLLR